MDDITIHVAGSSLYNVNGLNPSGFGAYLSCGNYNKKISVGFKHSNTYRMELRAVIHALSLIKKRSNVVVYCRNNNVVNLLAKDWLKIRVDKNRQGKKLNLDLWLELYLLCDKHNIQMFGLDSDDYKYKVVSRLAKQSANDFTNHVVDEKVQLNGNYEMA